jgi:ABC-type transport system involved in cytochrome c biogenesis permease subunit
MTLLDTYRAGKPGEFNAALTDYRSVLDQRLSGQGKVDYEAFFNRFDPFTLCMYFYIVVFLFAIGSWLLWQRPLAKTAFWVLVLAMVIHTFGLISRMYISGRPPVINLYSSAIFIAWGAVGLSIGLELIYRNGIGSAVGAIVGFCSLLIAQALSIEGDTMAQLRAVLDTNFWLATHVVVITLGYASTFLAGNIALAYIILGLFTPLLANTEARKTMARMIYGIVCFALLFSFVGTILGGIWADQSWGRFWGWDPKENGAILIVLWNAIILHARWGGLVRERGMAVLAVVGNIVTSWSWFGTNMLGVGLHSYGFMDKAFPLLIGYDLSQVVAVVIGAAIPLRYWWSFAGSERLSSNSSRLSGFLSNAAPA